MTLRVRFRGRTVGSSLRVAFRRDYETIARAATSTLREAARIIRFRGRQNIAQAGNFGQRWTNGLIVEPSIPRGETSITGRIEISHLIPYWLVFERGAVIRGRPLLWIPLSFARRAQRTRARDYPGRLFRVDRASGAAPLLLDYNTKEPQYFGKESVRIPKKFRIREIATQVANRMGVIYERYFRQYNR